MCWFVSQIAVKKYIFDTLSIEELIPPVSKYHQKHTHRFQKYLPVLHQQIICYETIRFKTIICLSFWNKKTD